MKRLIFFSAAGIVALVEILILVFPSLVQDLLDLMPVSQLPAPPNGFDMRCDEVERGMVETVKYDSQAAGNTRKICVYTPPRFSSDKKYPVLYLLHGSQGDETSWTKEGRADAILDNLYADNKSVPMIVIMPDGNLDAFERDLLDDIIPYIERHYPVKNGRQHRGLAGLSAGAHQALGIALAHPETFAEIGVFIGGLRNCEQFEQEHPNELKKLGSDQKPKLLWLASGKNDILYDQCQDALRLFKKYNISYVYVEGKGIHSWETARNVLFVFVTLVFHEE